MSPGAIEITHPGWLWLLAILAGVYILLRLYGEEDRYDGLARAISTSNALVLHPLLKLVAKTSAVSQHRSIPEIVLYWIVLTGLVISLAQPVRIGERLPDPPNERDIVFIVDTSVSMVLRDYTLDGKRIDRMSVIKALLDRFVQGLKGDRISVIVFADTAHILVPLTQDQELVRHMLTRISIGIAGRSSAIGEAVALAVKQTDSSLQRRRVLILISDGSQSTGNITTQSAAGLAANAGLPLYTIAVGAGTFEAEEKRTSGLIYHPADLDLMKMLAERTSARSYQAGDTASLQQAIQDISKLEKNTANLPPQYYRQVLYQWPLLAALLLLSLFQVMRMFQRQIK